jgi:hypothetical protein
MSVHRKALLQAYKEKPASPGVFALRCTASGQVWVQSSLNLESQSNRIWFSLRLGTHRNAAAQAAWNQHGAATFAFEVLERIVEPDLEPYVLAARLKARTLHWRTELGAPALAG